MTIEELLRLSAEQWEMLRDDDLVAMLEPYFKVTRPDPEKVKENVEVMTKAQQRKQIQKDYNAALHLARKLGIDV